MEQSYKEKYEQALERARVWKDKSGMPKNKQGILDDIFPELAESEGEVTRKEIINYFRCQSEEEPTRKEIHNKWIAWLENIPYTIDHEKREGFHLGYKACLERQGEQEKDILEDAILDGYILDDDEDGLIAETIRFKKEKQSEQEPADKVEPKFHEGEWVVNKLGDLWHIDSFDKKNYQVSDGKGNYNYFPISKQNEMRLWTIQDAKDGDVLAVEDKNFTTPFVAIFKERGLDFFNSYCFIGFDGIFYKGEEGHSTENIHPATTEQRDLLFQKMKEAGYEWNDGTKELKKIEQKTEENKGNIGGISPNWSEEDKAHIESILERLEGMCKKGATFTATRFAVSQDIAWLKSLRPQNRWKPSELQLECLSDAIEHYNSLGYPAPKLKELLDDLKKLKGEV